MGEHPLGGSEICLTMTSYANSSIKYYCTLLLQFLSHKYSWLLDV